MAFYFRHKGFADQQTFEFTHKSFGEYLTARRIVHDLAEICENLDREGKPGRLKHKSSGLKDSLVEWAKICGPTAMDPYLLRFIRGEIALWPTEKVAQWQSNLCRLIGYMLSQGMPMEQLTEITTFFEANRQARNAEESLLAVLSACALVTQKPSEILWPEANSFGTWLYRLQGQRKNLNSHSAAQFLNHLVLTKQCLTAQNLFGADLRSANLDSVDLSESDLRFADLRFANLYSVDLSESGLSFANLSEANLKSVDFSESDLRFANLNGSNLRSADLRFANLSEANLNSVDFSESDLRFANLSFANLSFANLSTIQWNEKTQWANAIGLHFSPSVPEELRQTPHFRAAISLSRGLAFLDNHQPKEALAAFQQALTQDPTLPISAQSWNRLCWVGSLYGLAQEVLFAGEKAVAMDPENKGFLDTRGLARALTGDLTGALADFKAILEGRYVGISSDGRTRRERWVEMLQAGVNPIDEAELKALREEEP